MSNFKFGRHWYGHILVPDSGNKSDPRHNAIAIDEATFDRIAEDKCNLRLPDGLDARWLGVNDLRFITGQEAMFLAVGHTFTEAFTMYGTVINELHDADRSERNVEYLRVMRDHYGIDLSNHPVRMMFGVNTEF